MLRIWTRLAPASSTTFTSTFRDCPPIPVAWSCCAPRRAPFAAIVVGLGAGRATFRQLGAGEGARPSVASTVTLDGAHSDQLARYLDDLGACRELSPAFGNILLHAAVTLMLDLLRPAASPADANASPTHGLSPKVQRCREIIQSELSDPGLGVRRLARELRCTADHLSRLFRSECGVALNAFIREERLRHAQS